MSAKPLASKPAPKNNIAPAQVGSQQ